MERARDGEVDQRSQGCSRQLPSAPSPRRPDAALGEPARWRGRTRHASTFAATPERYTGPVPIVTHVHGMEAVATTATAMRRRGSCLSPRTSRRVTQPREPGTTSLQESGDAGSLSPGTTSCRPARRRSRIQLATRLDGLVPRHTLGMTRLNVYAGPAASTSSGWAGRVCWIAGRACRDPTGPGAERERRVPAQQDLLRDPHRDPGRSFNANGSLFYPDSAHSSTASQDRTFLTRHFPFGTRVFRQLRHGQRNTWPFHNVEPRRYGFGS